MKIRLASIPRVGLGVLLALAVLAVTGCGGGGGTGTNTAAAPTHGGTLEVGQEEEALTLDPVEATTWASVNVINQISETLFKVNAKNENEPWLVDTYKKSADERIWTLRLRPGVRFSDGKPLTSADVAFSLEAGRKSPAWETLLGGIEKITTPSPTTVVITNRKSAPELPAILSQWSFAIVPKNYGGVSEKEFAQHPVGTGPFMLEGWKHGEAITLVKNPNYWKHGQPYLEKVVFHDVPNSSSRVAQLYGGQLDVVNEPGWSELSAVETRPGFGVVGPDGFTVHFMILNSRMPVFKDPKLREAITLALDREGIIKAAFGGQGEPAGAFLPPAVPFSDRQIEAPAQDLKKAKELVEEATHGASPSLDLVTGPNETTVAQIIQQNLASIGLKVKLTPLDLGALLEELGTGKFEIGIGEMASPIPSPAEMLGYYNALEGVYTGADTAETTQLTEEAASQVDETKRAQLYSKIQQVIANETFLLPIAYTPAPWALDESVQGFQVNATHFPWLAETSLAG
jgi:peptide/nickel transport system substrate-binding protein